MTHRRTHYVSAAVALLAAVSLGCTEIAPRPASNVEGIGPGEPVGLRPTDTPGPQAKVGSDEPWRARTPLPVVVDSAGRVRGRHEERRGDGGVALGGIGGDVLGGIVDVGVTITGDSLGVGVTAVVVSTRTGAAISADGAVPVETTDAEDRRGKNNRLFIEFGLGTRGFSNDPADARMAALREGASDVPAVSSSGVPVSFGGEIGLLHRMVSVGLRYQECSRTYSAAVYSWLFGRSSLEVFGVHSAEGLIDVRAWLPPGGGALVGIEGGIGHGEFTQSAPDRVEWNGTAPVYTVYGGFEANSGPGAGWLIVARAGYAWRDFGTLEERTGDTVERTDLDLSGPFFDVSVGFLVKVP